MQDYTTAAKDQLSAINDINSGSYTAADTLVKASTSATTQGTSALSRAYTTVSGLDS